MFKQVLSQDIAFFDKSQTGELINRLSSDVHIVSGSVTQNISDGLRSVAQISAGVGMMVCSGLLCLAPTSNLAALAMSFSTQDR